MDVERFNSAYRLALGITLLYVLWMLVPTVLSYTDLVVSTARRSQAVNPPQHRSQAANPAQHRKLSAVNLESALRQSPQFGPNSQLRCGPAGRDWDYVCSYMPTPLQSSTRLQFGVNVDATHWVKVSRVVPMGTILPPPGQPRVD